MSSWILRTHSLYGKDAIIDSQMLTTEVPSIRDIQETLVEINDKPVTFLNSTEWIGALEVSSFRPFRPRRSVAFIT